MSGLLSMKTSHESLELGVLTRFQNQTRIPDYGMIIVIDDNIGGRVDTRRMVLG